MTKPSLAGYGEEFQDSLMRNIFFDRMFADQISEILPYHYFTANTTKFFYRQLLKFKNKWKVHPTPASFEKNLKGLLLEEYPSEVKEQHVKESNKRTRKDLFEYWVKLSDSEREQLGDDQTKELALEFCTRQHLKKVILDSSSLLEQRRDSESIKDFLKNELQKGSESSAGISALTDFDIVFEDDYREVIPLPWSQINGITRGGTGRGELYVFIASTGGGKSHILVDCATHAYLQGYNVVYFTFELSDKVVLKRAYSNLIDQDIDELKKYKKKVFSKIKAIDKKHGNYLHVQKFPDKVKTTDDIRNALYKAENLYGKKPDLIVVDYADNIKATKADREYRFEINNVYTELRNIGGEFNAGVLSASQANRTAEGKAILTARHIAEAYSKLFPVDLAMTIGRTPSDKADGSGNLYVIKNRNGADFLCYLSSINGARSRIRVVKKLSDGEIKNLISNDEEK